MSSIVARSGLVNRSLSVVRALVVGAMALAFLGGLVGQNPVRAASDVPPGTIVSLGPTAGWPRSAYDDGDWASSDITFYFVNADHRIVVVTVNEDSTLLNARTYDPSSLTLVATHEVSYGDFPIWGGFLAAPDGNLYIAVGRENREESESKTVVVVRKYSQDWQLLGQAAIPGGASQGKKGIADPFYAGVGRMALCGTELVLHMARLMFKKPDGSNHQGNMTVAVDTITMAARTFQDAFDTYPYTSHSFNQFAACRDGNLVLVDHGDGYPRGILASVMRRFPPDTGTAPVIQRLSLWELPGMTGENFTGTTVTGLGLTTDGFLVTGNSVPHDRPVAGVTGSGSGLPHNIYLIQSGLESGEPSFRWISEVTGSTDASEPRLVPIDANRFALLFTITERIPGPNRRSMEYRLVDSSGAVLAAKTWPDRAFYPASDPIRLGNRLVWAQGSDTDGFASAGRGYLYALDVTDPANPQVPAGVEVPVTRIHSSLAHVAVEKGTWVRVPYVAYASQTGLTELLSVDSGSGRKAKAASVARARTNLKSTLLIRGTKIGRTKIVLQAPSGTRHALTVHVVKALRAMRGLRVSPARITMRSGKGTFLRATVRPVKAASKIRWRSSKPSVAAVDDVGHVQALRAGTAVITASSGTGGYVRGRKGRSDRVLVKVSRR